MEGVHTAKAKEKTPRSSVAEAAPEIKLSAPDEASVLAGLPLFLRSVGSSSAAGSNLHPPQVPTSAQSVVGQPNDQYEQEADAIAQQLTASSTPPQLTATTSARPKAQRKGAAKNQVASGRAAEATAESATQAGGGQPLPRRTRAFFESRLGTDLSQVRVHTGGPAAAAARSMHAKAFTSGQEIVFGAGQFAPETGDGQKLLAHELTHVAQQSAGGDARGGGSPPAIQRTPEDAASSLGETEFSDLSSAASNSATGTSSSGAAMSSQLNDLNNTSSATTNTSGTSNAAQSEDEAAKAQGAANASQGAEGAAGDRPAADAASGAANGEGGASEGEAAPSGEAGGGAAVMSGEASGSTAALPVTETGAGALGTGDLVLIDIELAEHQRWAGALGRVGEAASIQRAEFIAEAVGSGFIQGAASGAVMGLSIGLVTRAVPALGPIIGGGLALHGLVSRDWAATGATIGRFGEGNSTYEMLANTIDSISAVIDIVSQVLTVINGIVGIVQIAALAIAAGATVAAFLTFGATAGIAIAAGEVAVTCEEISVGINAVTSVLDGVNSSILQPCVTLFRALHTFTTQADPREVEAQGQPLSTAASASGAALGAWVGGRAAQIGARARPAPDDAPPAPRPAHETPPSAGGDGPVVHFQDAPASATHADAAPATAPIADAAPASARPAAEVDTVPPPVEAAAPVGRRVTDDQSAGPLAPVTDPTSFADLHGTIAEVNASPFGHQLESAAMAPMQDVPRDTARSPGAVRDAAYADIPNERPAGWDAPGGFQDQHWTKVRDATVNASPGTPPATVDAINANRSPLQTFKAEPASLLLTTQGVDPAALPTGKRGTEYFVGDAPMGRPAVSAEPGVPALPAEPGAVGGPAHNADFSYRAEHRLADRYLIPEMRAQIQQSRARAGLAPLDDVQLSVAAGEQARYKMEGVPRTDLAQRPVQPWSGVLVEPTRTPMQMLLAPEVLMPDLHARGRTVEVPRPAAPEVALPSASRPAPDPKQLSLPFDTGLAPTSPRPIGEGNTRSQRPLTDAEFEAHAAMAESMGMPRDQIQRWSRETSYGPVTDNLFIGPDIHPLPAGERPTDLANPANAALEPRAVLGHEIIGHREAELMGQVREPDLQARDPYWHEELQASARAALHTPDLSHEQSWLLMQDSAARRRHQTGDGEIYINTERYGARDEPGPPVSRPPEQFRPQDQLPSVIVDWQALGATPPRTAPGDAAQAASPPSPPSGPPNRPPGGLAPPGSPNTMPSWVPAAQAARNARSGATEDPHPETESPTWGTRAHQVGALFVPQLFGPDGPAATYAEQQAAHRARFTADNQPAEGVERVNPHYPSPPATPAQITALQNEIANLLAMRARAEQEAQHQSERAEQCEANQEPIQQTVADTTAGISAAQAHQEAITRREAVNQQQQQRQQESHGLVAGYPSRATGLVALTVPLAVWEGFTSLASHLPGEAGASMMRMNGEAQQLQKAFTQIGAEMAGVEIAGPTRQTELQGDQGRLAATGVQAQSSDQQLHTANEGAIGLQEANEATRAEAVETRDAATARAQECGEAVAQREEHADSLAEQMGAWAAAHQAARRQAITATEQRLENEGRTVIRSAEQ